jgi:hypothetical protein
MPLLPRFNRSQQEAEDKRKLEEIALEVEEVEDVAGMALRRSADGHNTNRRRGLPVISKGVGSTSPGTDPLAPLLQKEARGKRR